MKARRTNTRVELDPPPTSTEKDSPISKSEPDDPFPRQMLLFILLMAVSVIFRLALVLYSKKYLQSDEALVGVITLDIMHGQPIPIFPYGNVYAGGHIIEALAAIPLFKIFGPSDAALTMVSAMIGCMNLAAIYGLVYRFINKRSALIAVFLLSFSPPFLASNFFVNGGMTTSLLGWLGIGFFFEYCFDTGSATIRRYVAMTLSGIALGLAYYGFDYALFYLAGVLLLWSLRAGLRLWKEWRAGLLFVAGFSIGASPLIYFNLRHNFINFTSLFSRGAARSTSFPRRFFGFFTHDLPASFSVDIYDFPPKISLVSYLGYLLFGIAFLYALWLSLPEVIRLARAIRVGETDLLPRRPPIICIFPFLLVFFVFYTASHVGGAATRYLLPLNPFLLVILAWSCTWVWRRFPMVAIGFLTLFAGSQAYFMPGFIRDKSTVEWKISVQGESIKELANFLLDRNITCVMTPYEIKWKLMFETSRKILCVSDVFGFDREIESNTEVRRRVDEEHMPLAIVFDQEYKYVEVVRHFRPEAEFPLVEFFQWLKDRGIRFEKALIGKDYVVYYNFSESFPIPAWDGSTTQAPR